MRARASYGLSFCAEGKLTFSQNGKEFVSEPGYAFLLPEGQNYDLRGEKTGSFPVINFTCVEPLCDSIVPIKLTDLPGLQTDFAKIRRLFLRGAGRAKILSVFYAILDGLSAKREPGRLSPAVELIRKDLSSPELSNAKLAAACHMSEVYFRKLFTAQFGMSPKQFIMDLRLQQAKQLLSDGREPIAVIAEQCGFSNPYHFSHIFRSHVGQSPSDYRKERDLL